MRWHFPARFNDDGSARCPGAVQRTVRPWRATSLLLFEHVHGESRDRGQAMVDLLAQYEQHGLQLNSRELPDHLPLYLEYLAQLPQSEAVEG
ncbi:respiratory nitrate reductase 1 subunit delta [Escherichia coli]|nr:respiratory nitrate reductase 1 subunit delta [Escherichia coli]